jgi:uncharacterized protein
MEEMFDHIKRADIPTLVQLIREGPDLLGTTNRDSVTPLLFSVYLGKSEVAKAIYSTPFPFTLHERVAMNDIDKVRGMVEGNSTVVNSYSQDGWTPLHLAAFFGHKAMVQMLLGKGALIDSPSRSRSSYGNSPLQAAVAMGQFEVVKLLLDTGANVNFLQEPSLLTPLHIAASRKDLSVVRLLVERGAKRDAMSADGRKPADIATERQNEEVLRFLMET